MIKKEYLDLYKKAFLIRSTEEKISLEYSKQKMRCPVHLSIGQELVPSTLSFFLNKKDKVISTHRCHAHYLGKGGSLKNMIAELHGKKTGCASGKGGSMHLIDKKVGFVGTSAIVGHNIPVGVGLALSIKNKKKKEVVVIYLGDGAIEEGVFFESVNFAIIKKLPIIFICENNFYSVYSSLKVRQPKKRKISEMVKGLGIKSLSGDGYNIENTFKNLKKSSEFVKKGNGPIFLEFKTYRYLEHCGPDNDDILNYRNVKEVKNWLLKDPLKILKNKILKQKIINKKNLEKIESGIIKKILIAFKFAEISKFPSNKDFYKNLYV
jgi:TPP-dependent pyruvate/acetoin dehydrogenase alpha subunit